MPCVKPLHRCKTAMTNDRHCNFYSSGRRGKHISPNTHPHTRARAHTHAQTHRRAHKRAHTHTHTHRRARTHTHTRTQRRAHTHTHTHTHTYRHRRAHTHRDAQAKPVCVRGQDKKNDAVLLKTSVCPSFQKTNHVREFLRRSKDRLTDLLHSWQDWFHNILFSYEY